MTSHSFRYNILLQRYTFLLHKTWIMIVSLIVDYIHDEICPVLKHNLVTVVKISVFWIRKFRVFPWSRASGEYAKYKWTLWLYHVFPTNFEARLVVVIAKPARAVVLLLGDHDSSHASTDPLGGITLSFRTWSIQLFRGRPVRRFHWSLGDRPRDRSTWQWNALCAGTSCCSLATWPKRALRRLPITSEVDSKPVITATSSFRMNCCQLICSGCFRHFMWKPSTALISVTRRVQASAAYSRTGGQGLGIYGFLC